MQKRLSLLLLLLAPAVSAHAAPITFTFTSTFNAASPGGNIDGTLTYDSTSNTFTSGTLTTTNFPNNGEGSNDQVLNDIQFSGTDPNDGDYGILIGNITGAGLFIDFATSNFTQGSSIDICTTTSGCADGPTMYSNTDFNYSAISGSLSPINTTTPISATPEPSSLALLGTGLLGAVGVLRRRISA